MSGLSDSSADRGERSGACTDVACDCEPTWLGHGVRSWVISLTRSLQWSLLAFFLFACGGGGCGGCEACGVGPIPGGFPIEERVPNSAQVRLTSSGIDFIEANAGPLVGLFLDGGLDFEVPETRIALGIDICTRGPCIAHGEIDSLELTPVGPNRIEARVRVLLDSRDGAGVMGKWRGDCDIELDTRGGSRSYIGIAAQIDLVAETELARAGYTKAEIVSVGIADGEGLQNSDYRISGGFLGSCAIAGLFESTITDLISDQVGGILQETLDEQLCTTRGDFGCPTGTFAVPNEDPDSVCRYENTGEAACVPTLLGTDGQGDLGAAFLGGISPGTHAPGQFLLASGGDGESVNDGVSLFMYGGFIGTTPDFQTTPAHNPCVPAIDPPPLPTIPRVATFRGNSAPGLATPPHLGIGLAESYLDHAGYGMYDAGLLCIGAGTNLAQELSTGLFSLVVQSLGRLVFPEEEAPLAISLRPQTPPDFSIGDGTEDSPLLQIALDQMQMDFYVFSAERFIRFMTYEADLQIGINLRAEGGQLVPEIVELTPVEGTGRVFNSEELLREDPAMLADSMGVVLSAAAGMFAGGLGGFDLPDIMGLQLEIPEGGIQRVTEDGENFLGIFANLAVAPAPFTSKVDTRLRIVDAEVDPISLQLETLGQAGLPKVTLEVEAFDTPLAVDLEYSVRVDGMPWSRWTSESRIVLDDESAFLLQAKHTIEARARVAGEPLSADDTPAFQELIIDVLAPTVELNPADDGGIAVLAWDVVSRRSDLQVRHRIAGTEAWSEWAAMGDLGSLPAGGLDVEVKDEAGNVSHASSALIRGRPNPAGGGCECSVDGRGDSKAPFTALLLLAVFVLYRRRASLTPARRKEAGGSVGRTFRRLSGGRLFLNVLLPFAIAIAGCDCGGEDDDDSPALPDGSVPDDGMTGDMGPRPALEPGLLATHLDMVAQDDGTLVLAGYSPGNPTRAPYGDLVVGVWDPASEAVDWEIVDGAPDGPVTNEPGWRDGVAAPGDDVGRWASIIVAGGEVHVAYYDSTNAALKFASGTPGGSWTVHEVDADGDAGRYASLVATSSGVAVAYMALGPATETPGQPTGTVRVASASGVPTGATDWTVTEVTSKPVPCRAGLCTGDAACREDGQCVAPSGDCMDACADDEACFGGSCGAIFADGFIEAYPEATGLYASLATTSTGLALVWYDRTEGNIRGAAFDGSAWGEPFLIDGYGALDSFIGDSGVGASLFVDAADVWHVTYVDGAEETLRYARIEGGTVTTEVIDNGTTDGTTVHDDGRHIVGDDSAVLVTDGGEVRVAYQDATAGRAMFARRGGDSWTISVADEGPGFSGFFTDQVIIGGTSFVAHWWRNDGDGSRANGVNIVSIE